MAKKSSKKLNLVNLMAIALGIVSIVLFAILPMVKSEITSGFGETVSLYKGLGMIFGGTVNVDVTTTVKTITATDTIELEDVSFNTMAFVSFLLVVLGLVVTFATTFVKSFSKNKLFSLIAGALLVIGGILMFTVKESAISALSLTNASEYFSLSYGPIISGILAIVAGVAACPIVKK